jgi:hypothetical protein
MTIDSPISIMQYANSVTDGLFISGLILGFGIVLFISMKNYPTKQAAAAAGITTALLAILAGSIELLPRAPTTLFIILGALSVLAIITDN